MWQSVSEFSKNATPTPTPNPPQPETTHATDLAVERCCAAYRKAMAIGKGSSSARDAANDAFMDAMPNLSSPDSIRAFISCVTRGMMLGVFWNDKGPRLLACARAALAAVPRSPRERKKAVNDQLTEK